MIVLSPATTALILVDLQKGIVGLPTAPYSGEAVLAKGKYLPNAFGRRKRPLCSSALHFPRIMETH